MDWLKLTSLTKICEPPSMDGFMGSGLVYPLLFCNSVRGFALKLIPIRILHPGIPLVHLIAGGSPDDSPFPAEWRNCIPAFQGIGLLAFPSRERDSLYSLVIRCPLSSETGY